jgi:polysaccharide export outer membrane protein
LPDSWRPTELTSAGVIDLSTIARQSAATDLIYPGDVLEVTVATGIEEQNPQNWPLRVADNGQINVPLVGPVRVVGLTLTEAEQEIRRSSIQQEIYREPHVVVLMKLRKMIRVRVVGAVDAPGVYELPAAGSDLLAALVAAGGLSEKAGTVVEIRHPNSAQPLTGSAGPSGVMLASFVQSPEIPHRTVRVDLADSVASASEVDLHVEDGSVVVVLEKTKQSVSVIGLVRRPDNYELPTDEALRVLDAIALAGGLRVSVANRVRVIRRMQDQEDPIVIDVSLRTAKRDGKENLVLAAGDIVSVEETPTTFVVETVRGFLRFGFTSAIPGI